MALNKHHKLHEHEHCQGRILRNTHTHVCIIHTHAHNFSRGGTHDTIEVRAPFSGACASAPALYQMYRYTLFPGVPN